MAPIKAYPKLVHLVTSPDPEEMPVTSCDFNCFPCHIFGDWNLGGICCFGGVRRCLESKRKSIINLALTVFFFSNGLAPCTFRHVGWYNASRLVLCSNVEDVAVNGKLEKKYDRQNTLQISFRKDWRKESKSTKDMVSKSKLWKQP